jgi:hypothetical protein
MRAITVVFVALALSSSAPFVQPERRHFDDRMTVYEVAEVLTGAPAGILHGIACAESDENDAAIGDQGRSRGRFQINEDFRAERVRLYGEYDPHDATEAAILAGRIYMANLARLGNEADAIAAHRQGVNGVKRNGAAMWYVERVYRGR